MKDNGQRKKQQHPTRMSMMLKWWQLLSASAKNEGICAEEGLSEEKQTKVPSMGAFQWMEDKRED